MHFLVSTSQEVSLIVNNFKIENSACEKLLGVKFDPKLRFDQTITDLSRRASFCFLMNFFFKVQRNYCPLIWMSYSRDMINSRHLTNY